VFRQHCDCSDTGFGNRGPPTRSSRYNAITFPEINWVAMRKFSARRQRAVRSLLLLPATLFLCASLEGCSYIPDDGPSGRDLLAAPTTADQKFALVEINQALIDVISNLPDPSFFGRFGDHRPSSNQTIGVGDSVQITLWEAAAGGLFSTPVTGPGSPGSRTAVIPAQTVNEDGAITIPYAGRIPLVGKTAPQVEQTIVDRLQGKAIEPQAVLTIVTNVSNTATVMGDVNTASRVTLSPKGDRILDALALAGGNKNPVYETVITLTRHGQSQKVPMQALLTRPKENIYVHPGDNITLVREPETFTAVGATGSTNATVTFDTIGISLDEAVAKAGGLLDTKADPGAVFVMRYEDTSIAKRFPGFPVESLKPVLTPIVYHINLRDPNGLLVARRFPMRDKDILYISDAATIELQKVMDIFASINQPLASTYYVKVLGSVK
jgi:polysaccharide export outer membrane protein